jgi:hypothetical protein
LHEVVEVPVVGELVSLLLLLLFAAGLDFIPVEAVLLAEAAEAVEGVEVAAFEGVEFEDDLGGEVDLFFAEMEVGEVGKGGEGVGEERVGELEVAAEVPPGVEVGEGGEGGLEAELFLGEAAGALEAERAVKPLDESSLLLRGQGLEFGVASGFSLYVAHAGREHGGGGEVEIVLHCLHSFHCGFLWGEYHGGDGRHGGRGRRGRRGPQSAPGVGGRRFGGMKCALRRSERGAAGAPTFFDFGVALGRRGVKLDKK